MFEPGFAPIDQKNDALPPSRPADGANIPRRPPACCPSFGTSGLVPPRAVAQVGGGGGGASGGGGSLFLLRHRRRRQLARRQQPLGLLGCSLRYRRRRSVVGRVRISALRPSRDRQLRCRADLQGDSLRRFRYSDVRGLHHRPSRLLGFRRLLPAGCSIASLRGVSLAC